MLLYLIIFILKLFARKDIFKYIKKNHGKEMGKSIQEWTKQNLWKTEFKKFEGVWSALGILLQILQRLSSTNFTWSILEYFVLHMIWSMKYHGRIIGKIHHCVKIVQVLQSKYGKIRTRKTPYLDTFYAIYGNIKTKHIKVQSNIKFIK